MSRAAYPLLFLLCLPVVPVLFLLFSPPPTTELYTLSLHDALPILTRTWFERSPVLAALREAERRGVTVLLTTDHGSIHCETDRKSTRLNSSHVSISYAVFCLKKKKKISET